MMQYDADVHTELIDHMRPIQLSHLMLHLQSQISTEVSIQRFAQWNTFVPVDQKSIEVEYMKIELLHLINLEGDRERFHVPVDRN